MSRYLFWHGGDGTDSIWTALNAKVMVKFGKCLTEADFAEISSKDSVADISAYLKETPAYRDVLSDVNPSFLHRGQLEDLVRRDAWNEYIELCGYVSSDRDSLLGYFRERCELEQLLSFVNFLNCSASDRYALSLPAFMAGQLSFDLYGLASCADADALAAFLAGTPYAHALEPLPVFTDGKISIPETEARLFTGHFVRLFNVIDRTSGETRKELKAIHGRRLDLMNLNRLLRLRLNFGTDPAFTAKCVIEKRYLLSRSTMYTMVNGSRDEIAEAVKETPYGRGLREVSVSVFKNHSGRMYGEYCRRVLKSGVSPAAAVTAYLELRQHQTASLVSAIERVRYGIHGPSRA